MSYELSHVKLDAEARNPLPCPSAGVWEEPALPQGVGQECARGWGAEGWGGRGVGGERGAR